MRVVVPWHLVAPHPGRKHRPSFHQTDPAAYDWYLVDRIVSEVRAAGLKILMTPSGPAPRRATLRGASTTRFPSATRFGRFVQALGTRYRTQVGTWSVWNEPNLSTFLGPQCRRGKPYSPKLYRRLYQQASGALKASGNGRDRVADRRDRAALSQGQGDLAVRVLPRRAVPGQALPQARKPQEARRRRLGAPPLHHRQWPVLAAASIGTLDRLTSALYKAGRARALKRGASLWLTEFGVQSYPDPYVGVSQQRQSEWRSIGEWIACKTPRVKAFSQYLLRDDLARPKGHGAKYSGFETGLRRSNGRRKTALSGFRLPLVADRAGRRGVDLWGLVRPTHPGCARPSSATTATAAGTPQARAHRPTRRLHRPDHVPHGPHVPARVGPERSGPLHRLDARVTSH